MRIAFRLHHVPVGMLRAILNVSSAERTLKLHYHVTSLVLIWCCEINNQFQVVGIALNSDIAVEDGCEAALVEHCVATVLVEHIGACGRLDADACREGISLRILAVVEEAHTCYLNVLLLHLLFKEECLTLRVWVEHKEWETPSPAIVLVQCEPLVGICSRYLHL